MPNDEELKKRGCQMASVCSLCGMTEESSAHLFLQCSYALEIWKCLSQILNLQIDTSSILNMFSICNNQWSSQLQDIISAIIIHVIWVIWFARNSCRCEETKLHPKQACNLAAAATSLSGKFSFGSCHKSISEFSILKSFSIDAHFSKAPKINEVIWMQPLCNWIKANSDGAAHGNPGISAYGGIFQGKMLRHAVVSQQALESQVLSMQSWLELCSQLKLLQRKDGETYGWKHIQN